LAVIVWHILTKDEDCTWDRPALLQWKLRKLALKAGHPSRRGGKQKGSAAAYSNKSVRDSERYQRAAQRITSAVKCRPPNSFLLLFIIADPLHGAYLSRPSSPRQSLQQNPAFFTDLI